MQQTTSDTNMKIVNPTIEREYVDKERRIVKLNEVDREFISSSIMRNIDVFKRLMDK
jgi:hypothetical protein